MKTEKTRVWVCRDKSDMAGKPMGLLAVSVCKPTIPESGIWYVNGSGNVGLSMLLYGDIAVPLLGRMKRGTAKEVRLVRA